MAADILAVAQRLGARLRKISATEHAGPCPKCGGRDRFSVNVARGLFNCRRCNVGGDAIALARHLAVMSYADALAFVGDERAFAPHPHKPVERRQQPAPAEADQRRLERDKAAHAIALWQEAADPRGTIAEGYLNTRGLALDAALAGPVLRYHAGAGALLALFRNALTGEAQAVSRTFLSRAGSKLDRKFLGPVGGAAIQFDQHDDNLTIAEGIESALTARAFGMSPAWAAGSVGAIAALPIIPGVRHLRICIERDESGASERAAIACAARWHAAGRKVAFRLPPPRCGDLNDAIRADAR